MGIQRVRDWPNPGSFKDPELQRYSRALYEALVAESHDRIPDFQNIMDQADDLYVRVDGTKALTANWDAGGYEIRALTFESDVATGTAPLTIASATLVTNLNADLLDGNEAAAFAPASHNVLSATHADSTASTVVRGDIIIGSGATPKWDNLAVGASGTYLAGGTEPSWATLNQAAVAGLTTTDGPTFDHLHITNAIEAVTNITATGTIKSGDGKAYQGTLATSVSDDTAISFTPTANLRFILCLMGQQTTQSGLFACRVSASGNFCEILAAGAGLAATTGALSGTTGADGVMTISTHTDGKVYIENRLGGTRSISYMLIATNA